MQEYIGVLGEVGGDNLYNFCSRFINFNELGLGFLFHKFIEEDYEKQEGILAIASERATIREEKFEEDRKKNKGR